MKIIEKGERAVVGALIGGILKYVDKNPKKNLTTFINIAEKLLGGTFPKKNIEAARQIIAEGDNVYYQMAMNVLKDIDRSLLKKLLLSMGLGAGVKGTKAVRKNR